MGISVRHIVSTHGRLPADPAHEPGSGVVGAALNLAAAQSRSGAAVELWGWNDDVRASRRQWGQVGLWSSPTWRRARFARWDLRWIAPVLAQAIASGPMDLLHVHVDPNLLLAPWARARVLHLQTPVLDPFPAAYKRLLSRADAVIACSAFIRDRFLAASGYASERTFVVHNGADTAAFERADGRALRAEWELSPDDVVVLYAGAIVPEKGVSHLVRAFRQIEAEAPHAALVLVGGAQLWLSPESNATAMAYEAEVRALAQGGRVKLVGTLPRQRMPEAFVAADIVAVPSIWADPFPLVVCEAMAAGGAVVASNIGGIPEMVQHGHTGLLVPPDNVEQLATALRELYINRDLRHRLGAASRAQAQDFSWEVAARQTNGIYQRLLASMSGVA